MIAVLQAAKEGKLIQYRITDFAGKASGWEDAQCPCFDFTRCEYRIKPEPMEIWVNVYPDGTVGGDMSGTKKMCAMSCAPGGRTVKFREVLDE